MFAVLCERQVSWGSQSIETIEGDHYDCKQAFWLRRKGKGSGVRAGEVDEEDGYWIAEGVEAG